MTPPTRVFKDISINWEVCEADVRCISWILDSTTDTDVIFSTVWFAVDTIWYPEIAGALSPHVLANLFFDCLLDGQVIHSKAEHASSIGMALKSVLSIQLTMESVDEDLGELCRRIVSQVQPGLSSGPTLLLIVAVLKMVAGVPTQDEPFMSLELSRSIPDRLSYAHSLWLSRVLLQTSWRWRHAQGPTGVLNTYAMESICRTFATGGGQMPNILKINLFLVLAISLGLQVDVRDLYVTSDKCVTFPFFLLTPLIEL